MNEMVVASLGNVNTVQGALQNLRSNRLDRALELLEQGLDVDVIMLDSIRNRVDPASGEQISQALRWIRDYRRAHPRRTETDLSKVDEKMVADSLQQQERVRQILDEIK